MEPGTQAGQHAVLARVACRARARDPAARGPQSPGPPAARTLGFPRARGSSAPARLQTAADERVRAASASSAGRRRGSLSCGCPARESGLLRPSARQIEDLFVGAQETFPLQDPKSWRLQKRAPER